MATATQPQSSAQRAPIPPAATRAPGGRRRIVLGLVALAAVLGLGWAVKQWLYGRSHESTDNAQVDGHLVPVLAKVSGYVTAVNVAENDRVRADSTLVRIDEREYAVRVAQADAEERGEDHETEDDSSPPPGRGRRRSGSGGAGRLRVGCGSHECDSGERERREESD